MELTDYMRYRWKVLASVAVLGLAVIVVAGLGLGESTHRAKAQLIVRPPTSQLSVYGPNLDRYITTEMALLYTPESLRSDASGTGVTAAELARSLEYTHDEGSDIVNLQVTRADPDEAVLLVNKVADNYVAEAVQRGTEPAANEAKRLQKRLASARKQLAEANAEIERAAFRFAQNNPDRGVPPPASLSPSAWTRQSLVTSELQRLGQQQAALDLAAADAQPGTRVLRAATGASSQGAWAPVTFIAAALGLVLLLLALGGFGLALSRRVLGEGRWGDATGNAAIAGAVRLRGRTESQRRETVRRTINSLRAVGDPGAGILVAHLPEETEAVRRQAAFLVDDLADAGLPVKESTSLDEVLARHHAQSGDSATVEALVLLLVDLQQSTLDEAALLANYPAPVQRRILPVLV